MPVFDFDVSTYEAPKKTSFEPLPPGDYNAIITDSQMKITKAGTGEYLELTMQVIDGAHSGRRLWERLNVVNANKTAEEIAAEASEMTVFEDFVQEEVMEGRSIIGLYPPTDPETPKRFAVWRAINGR